MTGSLDSPRRVFPALPIEGSTEIRLRPLALGDAEEIQGIVTEDPTIGLWEPWAHDPAVIPQLTALAITEMEAGSRLQYNIVEISPTEPIVGGVGIQHNGQTPEGEGSFWLTQGVRGRGLATRAMRTLIDHAQDKFQGIQAVRFTIGEGNSASEWVVERLGAERAGRVVGDKLGAVRAWLWRLALE